MMRHEFGEKLQDVEYLTRKLSFKVPEIVKLYKNEYITFDTPKEKILQKSGIDGIIRGQDTSWDSKILFNLMDYNNRLLIETKSIIEKNTLGWVYTSQCDLILLCWAENTKIFMPIAYALPLKKFRKTELYKNLEKYKRYKTKSSRDGRRWTTEFYMVPINKFPKGFLIQFNPEEPPKNLPKTLSDWG